MTARPWMKWFPSDWRADPKLRACEPLSRYVWMEMLGLMHEAEPYGHLVSAGRAMDYRTLSRLVGVDVGEVKRAVKELEDRGVFSRTDDGVIYSRRMIRDEQKRKTLTKNGREGGNPVLLEQRDRRRLDNQGDNHGDKAHKPEARGQEEEKDNPPPAEVIPMSRARETRASSYAFEGKIVRLNEADLDQWRKTFCQIRALEAELFSVDAWLVEHKHEGPWFHKVSGMLARKCQEIAELEAKRKKYPGGVIPMHAGAGG